MVGRRQAGGHRRHRAVDARRVRPRRARRRSSATRTTGRRTRPARRCRTSTRSSFLIVRELTRDVPATSSAAMTDIYSAPQRQGRRARSSRSRSRATSRSTSSARTTATLFLTLNMNHDAAKAGKLPEYKVKWFRDQRFRQAIVARDRPRGDRPEHLPEPRLPAVRAATRVGAGPFQHRRSSRIPYDLDQGQGAAGRDGPEGPQRRRDHRGRAGAQGRLHDHHQLRQQHARGDVQLSSRPTCGRSAWRSTTLLAGVQPADRQARRLATTGRRW